MDMGLKDKIVLITGASTGIGYATALAFAREGAKVAICARRVKNVEKAIGEAGKLGLTLYGFRCDVSKKEDLETLFEEVNKALGGLDVLINNAGVGAPSGPLIQQDEGDWDWVMDINLKGAWYASRLAVPLMRTRGGGVILNTSSFASVMPSPGGGIYAISKGALNTLTQVLAGELAKDNIRVNAIIPGRIETPMAEKAHREHPNVYRYSIALDRFGTPEDVAPLMVFLASEGASYITGQCMRVCGGKFIFQPMPEQLM